VTDFTRWSRAGHFHGTACLYQAPAMKLALALTALISLVIAGAAEAGTWSPPRMTGATTIQLSTDRAWYPLDRDRDYILKLPPGGYTRGGLTIDGGRNVTLIGGHIWVPETGARQLAARRGLLLVNQRGTVHVEGVQIDGPGLSEGIQLGQPFGSTVQLEDIFIGYVRARDRVNFTDNHPDLVQTWAGPKRLLIDGLSGTTDFQGLFLEPVSAVCSTAACQPSQTPGRTWDLRNIDIKGTSSARVLFWKASDFPISQANLWAKTSGRSPHASVWPSQNHWYGLHWGAPSRRMVSNYGVGSEYRWTGNYLW
jgi:hypothetical protein